MDTRYLCIKSHSLYIGDMEGYSQGDIIDAKTYFTLMRNFPETSVNWQVIVNETW